MVAATAATIPSRRAQPVPAEPTPRRGAPTHRHIHYPCTLDSLTTTFRGTPFDETESTRR